MNEIVSHYDNTIKENKEILDEKKKAAKMWIAHAEKELKGTDAIVMIKEDEDINLRSNVEPTLYIEITHKNGSKCFEVYSEYSYFCQRSMRGFNSYIYKIKNGLKIND